MTIPRTTWAKPAAGVVTLLLVAVGMTSCAVKLPQPVTDYPDPNSAVCVPTGDPGIHGRWGPLYACVATALETGRIDFVAYVYTTDRVFYKATGWSSALTYKPVNDEHLAAYHLTAGSDAVRPPVGPGCLYDGGRLICVSPAYPRGIEYTLKTASGPYTLYEPPQGGGPRGAPTTLTRAEAKAFFAGYAIWVHVPATAPDDRRDPFAEPTP